ncbi:MAG: hypothetical protein EAZ92_00035, partial [Candidatus Kapaibacterium sp.]
MPPQPPPLFDSINPAHLDLGDLQTKKIAELTRIAKQFGIPDFTDLRKQDLIFKITEAAAAFQIQRHEPSNAMSFNEGVLELLPDGYGFLRSPHYNYLPSLDDIYVSPSQIKRFGLRTGDTVNGQVRPPKEAERFFALLKVDRVNYVDPEIMRDRTIFDNLTPL